MVQRRRSDAGRDFLFLGNFTGETQPCLLGRNDLTNLETGRTVPSRLPLAPYQSLVLASP